MLTGAMIRLHKYADGIGAVFLRQLTRGGPNAPFEIVTHHSCAAADVSFRDRTR